MPENSSSSSAEESLPLYGQSPKMLFNERRCNDASSDALKSMTPERRWQMDNRIPTWKYGMVNFGYGQNFVFGNPVVNDTDHRRLRIVGDVETEDGVDRGIVGIRDIRYNGQWFTFDEKKQS